MRLVLFGSSIVSAYWNGAATYYRGICKAMHARGHELVFVEPDLYDRQAHRDLLEDPPYAEVRVCRGWDNLARELERARGAQLVAKCSGVGGWDLELARGVLEAGAPGTLVAFWDVDAPTTLGETFAEPPGGDGFRGLIPRYDLILLYGGGPPVEEAYARLGARATHPIYNAVDPDEYFPTRPDPARAADLLFMGNRLPDREERVRSLFFRAAELAPELRFILGGEGWGGCPLPSNVRWIGHVPTAEHRSWNCSARTVLNINREAMASYGFSPPTRIFEAAGCGCCLITDAWDGMEGFFEPGREILVAGSAEAIVGYLRSTPPARAEAIGTAARARVLRDHTYDQRAALLDAILEEALARRPTIAAPSIG
ncbi:MAG: glycosyltransferase [Chloroflexi bacterium]|nr:glycosyltransferase [Chloroflexota bacterium]